MTAKDFEMLKVTTDKDKFRKAAIHYEKYECYTFAPPGTSEFFDYWDKELEYCRYGYTAEDGDRITGYNYFYLNYSRIMLVKEVKVALPNGKFRIKAERLEDFPRFYDYDRAYFDAIERAELEEKHLTVLKARGKGYSYKGASMLARNYICFPGSTSYALAAEAEFLMKDGLLTKAWDMIEWINNNTAFYKEAGKKNQTMHKRASFERKNEFGVWVEEGYKSEIIGVTLKNDAQKARGKRGKLILFEEAGKFPNLKAAWQIARPSVEEDGKAFGLMIAFGTGGTEDADYEGLKDLFYEPKAYNCVEFENVWDDGMMDTTCGFFVPQSANVTQIPKSMRDQFKETDITMDENGNTQFDIAAKVILIQRQDVIDHASDRRAVDRHIAEQPLTPAEATLDISSNIFPKLDLQKHLAYIRNTKKIGEFKQVGELYYNESGILKWEQTDPKVAKDLTKYRLNKGDDPTGQIVIWEHPPQDIPFGLYIAGCDPYDHDKSGTNSLGSIFIYKRINTLEEYHDMPVAEYTGRPDTANEFYETVRKLLEYYNATLLYENEKKGLFFYFEKHNITHKLADQPNDLIGDIVRETSVQRKKGIHMNQHIKDWGEGAIRDWLIEEYAPGKRNLTKILSEALIEELIAYNDEGNFDRVMAFMMVIMYKQQLHRVHVKNKKKINRRMQLFPDGLYRENSVDNPFTSQPMVNIKMN